MIQNAHNQVMKNELKIILDILIKYHVNIAI